MLLINELALKHIFRFWRSRLEAEDITQQLRDFFVSCRETVFISQLPYDGSQLLMNVIQGHLMPSYDLFELLYIYIWYTYNPAGPPTHLNSDSYEVHFKIKYDKYICHNIHSHQWRNLFYFQISSSSLKRNTFSKIVEYFILLKSHEYRKSHYRLHLASLLCISFLKCCWKYHSKSYIVLNQ